jgi:hypothetical protein
MKTFVLIIWCTFLSFSQQNPFPADSMVSPWHLVSTSTQIPSTNLPASKLLTGILSVKSAIYSDNGKVITINICDYGTESSSKSKFTLIYNFCRNDAIGYYPDSAMVVGYSDSSMILSMIFKYSGKYIININTDTSTNNMEQARQMELLVINSLNSNSVKYFSNRSYSKINTNNNKYYLINGKSIDSKTPSFTVVKHNVAILK